MLASSRDLAIANNSNEWQEVEGFLIQDIFWLNCTYKKLLKCRYMYVHFTWQPLSVEFTQQKHPSSFSPPIILI